MANIDSSDFQGVQNEIVLEIDSLDSLAFEDIQREIILVPNGFAFFCIGLEAPRIERGQAFPKLHGI